MARTFTGTETATNSALPSITYPLTLSCLFRPSQTPGVGVEMAMLKLDGSNVTFYLGYNQSVAAQVQIRAIAIDGNLGSFRWNFLNTTLTNGTWYSLVGVFTSAASITLYLDGSNAGMANATIGADPTSISATSYNVGGGTFGDVAETAVWDAALTEAEAIALSSRLDPRRVRPGNLIAYSPLIGNNSPEIEIVSGLNLTLTGPPAKAAHPRVIYPKRRVVVPTGAAALGTASNPQYLVDMGGWTTYTPKTRDTSTFTLTNFANQPGSRIYYIDWSAGVDATADFYFWNGTNIIDSSGSTTGAGSVAYGTDPFNPSGPVKPYKHYSWVGPHRNGADINTADDSDGAANQIGYLEYNLNVGRHGKPDWWLFKRGVTHDLKTDFEDRRGGGTTTCSLSAPGGESTTYRSLHGAWGNPLATRPKITRGSAFVGRWSTGAGGTHIFKNHHYVSLHFDGHVRPTASESNNFNFFYSTAAMVDIQWEDVLFDGTSGIEHTNGEYTDAGGSMRFFRCIGLYSWKPAGSNTYFIITGLSSTAVLKVEQSIFGLNAYRGDPERRTVTFTAALTAATSGTLTSNWAFTTTDYTVLFSDGTRKVCTFTAGATSVTWTGAVTATANAVTAPADNAVTDRTFYCGDHLDCLNSIISENTVFCGGSAEQFRAGLRIEKNYFVSGGLNITANGGNAQANSGTCRYNVHQLWMDLTGSPSNPPYGLSFGNGAFNMDVSYNLVTNQGLTAGEKTSSNTASSLSFGGVIPSFFHAMVNKCTGNTSGNNVFVREGQTGAHIAANCGSYDTSQPSWTISNTITATAPLVAATSCTLTTGWASTTGSYTLTFSDTSTRTATLTNGNTAVSWSGAVTATATITTPTYATWVLNGNQYTMFPDQGPNTFDSTNTMVGGATKTNYSKQAGATAPWAELNDTNTYTGGGGTIYATIAAFTSAVPSAIDPTRTMKSYMTTVLPFAFPSVTSKEGGVEFAEYVKLYIRKNTAGGGVYGFDERFLGKKMRNWVTAGSGMTPV